VLEWLTKIIDVIVESLNVPLKVALFFLNMLIMLFFLLSIRYYGYYPVLGIILTEAPVAYLVIKEVWRQVHSLPKLDGFELSPERMDEAIRDYVQLVKRQKN
jgi:hypothetical protein